MFIFLITISLFLGLKTISNAADCERNIIHAPSNQNLKITNVGIQSITQPYFTSFIPPQTFSENPEFQGPHNLSIDGRGNLMVEYSALAIRQTRSILKNRQTMPLPLHQAAVNVENRIQQSFRSSEEPSWLGNGHSTFSGNMENLIENIDYFSLIFEEYTQIQEKNRELLHAYMGKLQSELETLPEENQAGEREENGPTYTTQIGEDFLNPKRFTFWLTETTDFSNPGRIIKLPNGTTFFAGNFTGR